MKLPYRSEIDGLRTIAVLSVILYHAQIVVFGHDFFKGGFVGVDIFFVISGYLISRILLSELFEKGKISFLQFYERRARRILPILFTVFIVSFPLAYKYLMPHQFVEYAHSILSATFFGSNIFFYFTNTQYGAEDSLLQPFLHTWSLGVEEQFYILFPIVLLLAYKFAKNHLFTIIAVLILISLTYADWQSTENTQLNFFMLTSRLWELGIGSLLAFYELKYGRVKHELLNQTMPLLGLAMITYAIVFFNNQTPHPSLITLLPTLGTALIILYSVNKTDLVGKVLGWKPIVGIGLISYSMYLWHYPIFAFVRLADSNVSNDEKYFLILLTITLSIISYFVIEKPFRNKQYFNFKSFIIILLIIFTVIVIKNLYVINSDGISSRFDKFTFTKEYILNNSILQKESWTLVNKLINKPYKIEKNKVLIFGNSHAKDFYNGFIQNKKAIMDNDFKIIKNPNKDKNAERVFIGKGINSQFRHSIYSEDFYIQSNVVIISIALTETRLMQLDSFFKKLSADNKKVIVVLNKPHFNLKKSKQRNSIADEILFEMHDENLSDNVANKVNLTSFKKIADIVYDEQNGYRKLKELNDKLRYLANKYNFMTFDIYKYVCDDHKQSCDVLLDNMSKTYYNYQHWTLNGSKWFVDKMIKDGFLDLLESQIEN
jgi:peptidoglycan/LPS O-acetylase OafA/YrhL